MNTLTLSKGSSDFELPFTHFHTFTSHFSTPSEGSPDFELPQEVLGGVHCTVVWMMAKGAATEATAWKALRSTTN